MTGFTYRAETYIYKAFMKVVASCEIVEIYMGLIHTHVLFECHNFYVHIAYSVLYSKFLKYGNFCNIPVLHEGCTNFPKI
jgi:hypothetical protein